MSEIVKIGIFAASSIVPDGKRSVTATPAIVALTCPSASQRNGDEG